MATETGRILLDRIRNHEPGAFDRFVQLHGDRIYGFDNRVAVNACLMKRRKGKFEPRQELSLEARREVVREMKVDDWLRLIAGALVLLSVALGHALSPRFLLFTAFVGANLLQSALTGWCPMMWVLRRLGVQEG